jgi:hypothetical protein
MCFINEFFYGIQEREEKEMTLQEFKAKAENNEELKQALKEALEKGDEALAVFLSEQGVQLASRVELSEKDLDNVVGGFSLNTIKNGVNKVKRVVLPNDLERQELKNFFKKGTDFVEKVVHDTIYTH